MARRVAKRAAALPRWVTAPVYSDFLTSEEAKHELAPYKAILGYSLALEAAGLADLVEWASPTNDYSDGMAKS